MISRRGFLGGLAGILAASAAPAIVHRPMKIWVPKEKDVYVPKIEVIDHSEIIESIEGVFPIGSGVHWYRDGIPIKGETGPSYTLRVEDAGHTIRVERYGVSYGRVNDMRFNANSKGPSLTLNDFKANNTLWIFNGKDIS